MNSNRLTPVQDVDALRKFDAICDSLEHQWRAGKRPRIADFLDSVTPSLRNELAMQLLEVEWEARIARQETPQAADYTRDYPALAEWIHNRLNQLLETASREDATVPLATRTEPRAGMPQAADPMLGKRFGKYELIERLGMGGMGAVYRARHTMIQSERALKLLHPLLAKSPAAIQRFLVEAQACIELSHAHVVTTYHVDQEQDGTVYIVMELLQGENLHQLIKRVGPVPVRQAATIIQQAASGLAFVHGRGTIHRDIKPHNIMWTSSGVAKILDLGLARILDDESNVAFPAASSDPAVYDQLLTQFQSRLTRQDALLGTLPYMAPEQAQDARRVDGRSDIYSLGCTFYFLLTGQHAFVGDSPQEILDKHLTARYAPVGDFRQDLPPELGSILASMMTKDRELRYPSADAVVAAIQHWLDHADGAIPPTPSQVKTVSLDDPQQLRDELVRLRVISRADWDQAEEDARVQQSSVALNNSTIMLDRPRKLQSTHVLAALRHRPDRSANREQTLSEFQIQYVLNGDQDLLRLPHHVLIDQVGGGWKGDVFKARNIEANRLEALRTFSPRALQGLDGNDSERTVACLAFVDHLARVEHPGIPKVYGGGRCENRRHGQQVYFASQFVDGVTIDELVRHGAPPRGEPADAAWCVKSARDVCEMLEFVHQQRILHLDIHGLSLKLDRTGRVCLLDLGVALLLTRRRPMDPEPRWRRQTVHLDTRKTTSRSAAGGLFSRATVAMQPPPLGTPTVMPPEQWQNRSHVSVATDIYNLGCTLFFMLAGQYPFQATSALDSMRKHLECPPMSDPLSRRIPRPLQPILEQALAKSPEHRFPSAQAMGEALAEVLQQHSLQDASAVARPSWLARLQRWMQRPGR